MKAEIEDVVGRYFDALHNSDAALMAQVMHPQAIYATADEHPALIRTMDEYLPILAKRPSPASRGEVRRDAIEAIRIAGRNTALAEVRCAIGERRFTDFLSLVRDGGQWRIIAKVFHIDSVGAF